jgi:plastocyanin
LNILIYRNNKKRCMKKLLVVLAILFIGILLAGCTSQPAAPVATPTPTPVPTTVPTTVAPTPEPTKVVVVVVENKTTTEATPTAAPTPSVGATITFTDSYTIVPGTSATIKAGQQVVWVNADPRNAHTVIATDATDGAWFNGATTGIIPASGSSTVTFNNPGMFEYTTGPLQPQMSGIITVTK